MEVLPFEVENTQRLKDLGIMIWALMNFLVLSKVHERLEQQT